MLADVIFQNCFACCAWQSLFLYLYTPSANDAVGRGAIKIYNDDTLEVGSQQNIELFGSLLHSVYYSYHTVSGHTSCPACIQSSGSHK